MRSVDVLIPARGNSERIIAKNLLQFAAGQTLLELAISDGKRISNRVVVSSDNPAILQEAEKHGAIAIERPAHLATSTSPTIDTIKHHVRQGDLEADCIALLQCTTPMRAMHLIELKLPHFLSGHYDCGMAVIEFTGFYHDQHGPLNREWSSRPRTQEVRPIYLDDGSFFIFSRKAILSHRDYVWPGAFLFVKPFGLDIDTEEDVNLAKYYAQYEAAHENHR